MALAHFFTTKVYLEKRKLMFFYINFVVRISEARIKIRDFHFCESHIIEVSRELILFRKMMYTLIDP